jgi:hypothetical protein
MTSKRIASISCKKMDEITIKMVLQEKQARKDGMNNSLGYQKFHHKYE